MRQARYSSRVAVVQLGRLQPASCVLLLATAAATCACLSSASTQAAPTQCSAGEMAVMNGSSQPCTKCDSSQARCLGGGLVLPAPGWWQASATSTVMNRCPNQHACLGFPRDACAAASHPQQALRQCHPSCNESTPVCAGGGSACTSTCSTADYQARQCAEGYSGTLCAVCSRGFGPKGLLLRCSRCIGQHTAAALFIVAVLVLLLGIRYWAFLAESENIELAAASCTMNTPAVHQPTPNRPQANTPAAPPPPSTAATAAAAVQLAHVQVTATGRQRRLSPLQQLPAVQPGSHTVGSQQPPKSTWQRLQQLARQAAAAASGGVSQEAQHDNNGGTAAQAASPLGRVQGQSFHLDQHDPQRQSGPASTSQRSYALAPAAAGRLPSFWFASAPQASESVTAGSSAPLSFVTAASDASSFTAAAPLSTQLPQGFAKRVSPSGLAAGLCPAAEPNTQSADAAGRLSAAAAGSASVSALAPPGISRADTSFIAAVSSLGGSSSASYSSAAEGSPAPGPSTAQPSCGTLFSGLSATPRLQLMRKADADPAHAAVTIDLAQSPLLPSTKSWSDSCSTAAAAAGASLTAAGAQPTGMSGSAGQHSSHSSATSAATGDIGCSRSRPSDVLRCLLLFLQFWTILASMQLQWPPVIAQPLAALGTILAAGHAPPLSVDCLITSLGLALTGESVAVARVVLLFCMPFVMLLVLLLIELSGWGLMLPLHRSFQFPRKPVVSYRHLVYCRMHLITLAAVFFFYPSLVRTCLQLFVCLTVHTGAGATQRAWAGYANMQCGSGSHAILRSTIGIIGVVGACFGMPLGMAYLLLRSSQRRDAPSLLRFGSLLRCYRGGIARAWESMIMVQTAVCVAITVFSNELGEFYQACLMNVMLTVAVAVLFWLTPYRCHRLQRLMLGGAICLTASSYVALVLLTNHAQESGAGVPLKLPSIVRGVAGVVVLLANMGCMLWGACEFLLAMDWQHILSLVHAGGRRMQVMRAAIQRQVRLCGTALTRHPQ
ncbi:hypothetical protein COO60DRAFT_1017537 [Scenedesmus sp. NREL 46B-D3]|nr:hypothetical protein COO60DRAFT_1017537 [Scenedesmus sp. NREL 46B-D3]